MRWGYAALVASLIAACWTQTSQLPQQPQQPQQPQPRRSTCTGCVRIEGLVEDARGRPVAGADVSLTAEHGFLRTVTDAHGRYAFDVAIGTSLGMLFVRRGVAVASTGVPRADGNIVVPTIALSGRFALGGPAQLFVEVTAAGKPIFATLRFDGYVLDSRDGGFIIDMEVRKVKVLVESPGFQSQVFDVTPAIGGVAFKRIYLTP